LSAVCPAGLPYRPGRRFRLFWRRRRLAAAAFLHSFPGFPPP